jgi:tetratricopeptide (TPR) repeat protein
MTEEFTEDILQTLKQLMQRFDVSTQVKPQDEFVVHNQTTLKIIHDAVTQLGTLDEATTPHYEQLTMMAGALLSSAGEVASAETLFSQARNLAKDNAKKALACYNLFQILVRCHSYARALEELQTAIKLDPSYALHDVHKYPIERFLGAGGMGCVFLCHDEWRENKVVVKCFWEGKKGAREEVFKEVLVMRQLQSPYVPKTISFGYANAIQQERPYFVTEYIEEALDGEMWLTRHGKLSLEIGLDVGLQVAEGLAMAHQVGVCHLDLKPSNLLFR